MKIEEKILVNELKNRNYNVFEMLFHDYYPRLIRYAEGFVFDTQVSEDIVQTIFIYVWENSQNINIESSLNAYLYTSVKNHCLNHLRSLHLQDKYNLLFIESTLNNSDSSHFEDPELIAKIKEAIEQLPEKMAAIFKLKYIQNKKNKEIADLMDISENTIKTQLQRAKAKLRTGLAKSTNLNFFL